jgi:NAD(P)-dependent dehydrogenase (short-subunit alcohol dehydrogenase family)
MYAGIGAGLPVGRIGEVDDVARAYLYTMDQPMATGTILLVDGGAVLV